jgi:mono/diheme cytochrome c family protein
MKLNLREKLSTRNRVLLNISLLVRGFVVAFAILVSSVVARGQDGAATFKTNCTPCHGDNGSANTPPGKSLKAAELRAPEIQKRNEY